MIKLFKSSLRKYYTTGKETKEIVAATDESRH
jgi:hypothetical protein